MSIDSPMTWMLFPPAREEEAGRFPLRRFGGWLARAGHRVAIVFPPASPWDAASKARRRRGSRQLAAQSPLGVWESESLFLFAPRTWSPVRPHWPLNGGVAWNAGVALCRPPAQELLREAGFDRCDAVVMASLEFPSLLRHASPRAFVLLLDRARDAVRQQEGHGASRGEKALAMDADLVLATRETHAKRARHAGAERVELLEAASERERFVEFEERVVAVLKEQG
jgi:hypothetical protein